ncbi:sulfurtransferase [Planosporangium thailandense]|uniref:Sulfurtransferase n=1 Tax=Planosporangium thailandense TaxID=765197 RepID=A0ABX0XQY9_9ACTN|nr:sulfurtransferase [Planosporangium thailandense]NJC68353.1 sulfurtransferase [Planosporangium thailandense]
MTDRQHLVDAVGLVGELDRDDPPTVLDVRWTLTGGGRAAFDAGHLPGAVFLDLDADLAGPPGAGGRHPLPDPAALQAALRRGGVRAGHPVVVYDAGGTPPTGAAARAWWILRWAGLADVRVLDGGYAAWTAAGGPVTRAEATPIPGDVTVGAGSLPVVDATGAQAVAADGVLIDARVPARFRGETEPVDPVAGHIPGARNQPAAETVDEAGRLHPPALLRAGYADLGVRADRPVAAYCGSGVTAAQTALALTVAGFEPALYIGSWSHWITDPERAVATGEEGSS